MFEHGFNPRKGWIDLTSLDCDFFLDASVTCYVERGRVVHVYSTVQDVNGLFMTVQPGAHVTAPAIFLIENSADYDVSLPTNTPSGIFVQQAIAPTGKMSGQVAQGGYEHDVTEYDQDQSYLPGELLTATASNTNPAICGLITNQGSGAGGFVKQFIDPVIGIVSLGARQDYDGINRLALWTAWLPGAYVEP
jgi:hypothetical protein